MKAINLKFSLIFIGLVFSLFSNAQTDVSEKLKNEIVNLVGGKYSVNDYYYLSFTDGSSMQIEIPALCPVAVMTRDHFVSIYTMQSMMLLFATLNEIGKGFPDIKGLDELIGEPDVTFNFVMAKNGMQIQVLTEQGKENFTTTWEEFFSK